MTSLSVPTWIGYLAAILVVIALAAVVIDARHRRHPSRRLWFAAMWLCYALSGVAIAAGLYLVIG